MRRMKPEPILTLPEDELLEAVGFYLHYRRGYDVKEAEVRWNLDADDFRAEVRGLRLPSETSS